MEEPHPGDHPTAAGDPTTAAGDPPTAVGDPPTAASLGQDEQAGQAHTPVDLGLATAAAQRTTSAGQGLDMAAAPEVQAALGMANQGMAPTNAKGKKMIRGPMTCKKCGEKGHRQASAKCPLNGTAKKR
jgi:hypothetical protein